MRLLLFILLLPFVASSQVIMTARYTATAAAVSCSYILDSLTTEVTQTAYSFRKLRSAYGGSCIRVRRSSDNTEQDFGYTGSCGFLDTASLKTFIGANSGYIVKIYDQSGNSRDMTQATAGSQMRIINAGSLEYDNGRITAFSPNKFYTTSAFQAYPDSITSNFVMRVTFNSSYNASQTKTSGNSPNPLDHYNATVYVGDGSSFSYGIGSEAFNSAAGNAVWAVKATSPNYTGVIKMWKNTTNTLSTTTAYYGNGNTALIIGTRGDNATGFYGYFFEAITFSAISENELINGLHANQINYYGY